MSNEFPSQTLLNDWMRCALEVATKGAQRGENPFGAAIYSSSGKLISASCNTSVSMKNPLLHAEVNAISVACESLGMTSLDGYRLVCTAEPCPMCLASAAVAGIRWIAFGANATGVRAAGFGDFGVTGSELALQFNKRMFLTGSVLAAECLSLLSKHRKEQA